MVHALSTMLASAESYEAGHSVGRVMGFVVIGVIVLGVLWVIKKVLS